MCGFGGGGVSGPAGGEHAERAQGALVVSPCAGVNVAFGLARMVFLPSVAVKTQSMVANCGDHFGVPLLMMLVWLIVSFEEVAEHLHQPPVKTQVPG